MELSDCKIGMDVIYIPRQANGDRLHPDCRTGIITSIGSKVVTVSFDPDSKEVEPFYPTSLEKL